MNSISLPHIIVRCKGWSAPMAPSVRLWLETQRYWVRIPVGSNIRQRGCAFTVLETIQKPGQYCLWYCAL